MSEQSAVAVGSTPGTRFSQAVDIIKPLALALPSERVEKNYLDIPTAVTTILGAIPAIKALRPEFEEHLPTFPMELFDQLETRALALDYVDTMYRMSTKQLEPLPQLLARGAQQLVILKGEADYAVLRNLMDGKPLAELDSSTSHRAVASNLFALTYLLRTNWPAIEGKTALTMQEISEAEQTADHIVTGLGARKQAAYGTDATADLRDRFFTLMIEAHDRVRGSLQYLYPKTYTKILPPLRETRGPAKPPSEEEVLTEIRAATGVHPIVQEPGAETASAADDAQPTVAVGKRGSNPYSS
jgi:hypothetical protein